MKASNYTVLRFNPGPVNYADEIKAGYLLDVIRKRPALYLDHPTITGLWHFLHGYSFAQSAYGIEIVCQLPNDFHEWIAYRLHYYESTSGWKNMILEHAQDEAKALDLFYELLDEHRTRQARVVATIQDTQWTYKEGMLRQDPSEYTVKSMPKLMALIAYTCDPGLFLTSETVEDFPGKDRLFNAPPELTLEMIKVLDQETFDRCLTEDKRLKHLAKLTAK